MFHYTQKKRIGWVIIIMDVDTPVCVKKAVKTYKGTLTFPKFRTVIQSENPEDAITKEQVAEVLVGVLGESANFIVAQETGEMEGEGGVGKVPYYHFHVAYDTFKPVAIGMLEKTLERTIYQSAHQRRDTAAMYVTKCDHNAIIHNWPTLKSDLSRARCENGEGIKRQRAKAAWEGDIVKMRELDMNPREVNAELQALPCVNEEIKKSEYERIPEMTLTFRDYGSKKSQDFVIDFDKKEQRVVRPNGKEYTFVGRRGIWVTGRSRTGKTYQAIENVKKYNGYRCDDPKNFDGYGCQQLIFLNDMDFSHFPSPSEFRRFIDAGRYNRKYGSKQVNPDDIFFVVTSNYGIRELYKNGLGAQIDGYSPSIEALEAVFFEVKLSGRYVQPGAITYGKAVFNLGDSEDEVQQEKEEQTPTFNPPQTPADVEIAIIEKAITKGDPDYRRREDGLYEFKVCDYPGDREVWKILVPGPFGAVEWRQEIRTPVTLL